MKNHEVIEKIILTEETYSLVHKRNTFVFSVRKDKNKIEIKKAIENAFNVKVVSVNTLITPSYKKAVRGKVGRKTVILGSKKAFVKVKSEDVSKIPLI